MTNKAEIRGTHPYAFRSGEWAILLRLTTIPVAYGERECYEVVFDDGMEDLWPVYDSSYDYEFRDASE